MMRLAGAGVRRGERWIFRKLDLELIPGRSLAVLGPNGRGKTTLIRAVMGLVPLREGERTAPRVIGYVPQSPAAPVGYRVEDFVVMGRAARLGLFGSPGRADQAAAAEALETVGAAPWAKRPVDRLSGGERQLVALARALATGSPLLVLDEPMSALDLANQARLLKVLDALRAGGRHAILFSTHAPEHALVAADEALLMMGTEERSIGPVGEVLSEVNLSNLYNLTIRRACLFEETGRPVEAIVPIF
ncbi:ABC transporter ATP-binding protein [Aureimonas pseudogalii]|nr:ABC transporter ATP-binding protein [Aureimonas pseudogalii]